MPDSALAAAQVGGPALSASAFPRRSGEEQLDQHGDGDQQHHHRDERDHAIGVVGRVLIAALGHARSLTHYWATLSLTDAVVTPPLSFETVRPTVTALPAVHGVWKYRLQVEPSYEP